MDMKNHTRITLAWELHEQGVTNINIAKHLDRHRETVGLWINRIKEVGLGTYLDEYHHAKKGERAKRKVDPLVKRWVWSIREREHDCCGQKVQYYLLKEHGLHLGVTRIYQILHEKFEIRSKWKKGQKRGPVPKAKKAREVVQMDTIDFGDIFAFTGIDIFSKEADILMAPQLTSNYGEEFLGQSMDRRFDGHVDLIQADGGSEFKDHFKAKVHLYCDRYRVARPYKKNEQAFIESFNRTVRKECLGWLKYKRSQIKQCQAMAESFLKRYHYHRPHMGLGMKPPLNR